jgi:hypothetical protein
VGFEPTVGFPTPVFKTEVMQFFSFIFCFAYTLLTLFLAFGALHRTFSRMAKKKKRPELVHCKVTRVANPRAPWRLWYATEQDGKTAQSLRILRRKRMHGQRPPRKKTEISNHGIRYGDIPPEVRRAFDFYRDEKASLEAIRRKRATD